MKEWEYNEFRQTGLDFQDDDEVLDYDDKYKGIRNYDAEVKFITSSLGLNNDSVLLEIGTGTGEHALRLARVCKKLVSCDISHQMLAYSILKAKTENITNIEFIRSGFLSYSCDPGSFDAVLSQLTLHHLPDFWKSAALQKISCALKSGGKLFLLDCILSFDIPNYGTAVDNIIEEAKKNMGERIAKEIVINIRDEYPTYDWIIEGMLQRTGLKLLNRVIYSPLLSAYICEKQ